MRVQIRPDLPGERIEVGRQEKGWHQPHALSHKGYFATLTAQFDNTS